MGDLQPSFARLEAALWGEQPDRVPLVELLMDITIKERFLGRPISCIADEVDFWYRAGYDYVGLPPTVKFAVLEASRLRSEHADAQARGWVDEGAGPVQSLDDLEASGLPTINDVDFSAFDAIGKHLPPGMKVVGRYGDIFTLAWGLLGFTRFSYALYEQPELIAEIFDRLGALVVGMFEKMAQYDVVGAMWYSDDIAYTGGLLVSPDVLRKHLFPWMEQIGAICRRKGVPFIYHTDGVLWDVFDDLVALGVNAIQPIEPKSMDIVEVKERYGDKLCVIGNVEVDLLARGTPDDIRAAVKELLRTVAPGGGYCLGSSNTIPSYADFDNYVAMIEAALEHGCYPIRV